MKLASGQMPGAASSSATTPASKMSTRGRAVVDHLGGQPRVVLDAVVADDAGSSIRHGRHQIKLLPSIRMAWSPWMPQKFDYSLSPTSKTTVIFFLA